MTTPPIDVRPGKEDQEVEDAILKIGCATYVNKMVYADAVVKIAEEFAEDGRVGCVDVWRALVNYGLRKEGKEEVARHVPLDEELVMEMRLPGSGLPKAKMFGRDVLVDGLHFGAVVSGLKVLYWMICD